MGEEVWEIAVHLRTLLATMTVGLTVIVLVASIHDCTAQAHPQVRIGNQIWMGTNLDVATFSNGESIAEA